MCIGIERTDIEGARNMLIGAGFEPGTEAYQDAKYACFATDKTACELGRKGIMVVQDPADYAMEISLQIQREVVVG